MEAAKTAFDPKQKLQKPTVNDLKNLKFVVPPYQRGYRWTKSEVTALLSDIYDFDVTGAKYCLQPLVVKELPNGSYEVVDGQQRLTTIFIFMRLVCSIMPSTENPFELKYDTRAKSADFLNALKQDTGIDFTNIDYYHMSAAMRHMYEWASKDGRDLQSVVIKLFPKIKDGTFFIWYRLDEHDADSAIDTFSKINKGKIPLTNSELIKALMLSAENYDDKHSALREEIALRWEEIERGLNDNSFWYFLNSKDGGQTRMDFLFNALAEKLNTEHDLGVEKGDMFAFDVIYALSQKLSGEDFINAVWFGENGVEPLYSELRSWYEDNDKYHLTGFLTSRGVSINEISDALSKIESRSDIVPKLRALIKKKVGKIDWDNITYSNSSKIREILLLFNIASLVGPSGAAVEKAKAGSGDYPLLFEHYGDGLGSHNEGAVRPYRFPFESYHNTVHDIEHMHAIHDKLPASAENSKNYLEALAREWENSDEPNAKAAADDINKFLKGAVFANTPKYKSECDNLYDALKNKYPALLQEDNELKNLALLDKTVNRGYKNVTFMQKRAEIINHEANGGFIPPCTKNAFLKVYSGDPCSPRWSIPDRQNYAQWIEETVESFWEGV